MGDNKESNLGGALTRLGLEEKFLENGALANFPLAERGRITNGIISEVLNVGRWQTVVNMIYGGFGKADALYEGDRGELKERILKSAAEDPDKDSYLNTKVFGVLAKANENDLSFKLAANVLNLNYESFMEVTREIDSSYFNDESEGSRRLHTFHEAAGKKALEEERYGCALTHFGETDNKERLSEIFESIMSGANHEWFSDAKDLLEEMALSDPEHKESRLRRAVLSFAEKTGLSSKSAFELYQTYDVPLSNKERASLYKAVAEDASRYELRGELVEADPKLHLLWAKKHAKDEPRTAYQIFAKQDQKGAHVTKAIISGLELSSYQNKDRVLGVNEVNEDDLKEAYDSASFNIKTRIAHHLQNHQELRNLSKQAKENGDLCEAYGLWVDGHGNLDAKYLRNIRTQLINDEVNSSYPSMSFIGKSDVSGNIEAYEALMEAGKKDNLRKAYEIALTFGEEDYRLQEAREAMVSVSPRWALQDFMRKRGKDEKVRDEEGVNYVLGVMGNQYGVEPGTLRELVETYH